MAYFAFVSYARVNIDRTDPADPLLKFLKAIERRIEQRPDILGKDEPMFLDETNIETGKDWNEELSDAAATSRVALAIYSHAYFSREYCGREFQVFRDRRKLTGKPFPVAIVPVLWQACKIPEVADPIQWADAALPPTYSKDGLEVISRLGRTGEYEQAVIAIAERICSAAVLANDPIAQRLHELANLDLKTYPFAFPGKPNIPGKDTIDLPSSSLKKTRFVFLSGQGWDWTPYANEDPIGLIAMDLAVKLKVKFEEIPCDSSLHTTLDETEHTGIPTLLIPDPSSVQDPTIRAEMADYDKRLYDNCGLVIPWDTPSPGTDHRWQQIKNICWRKSGAVLQNHEWTSVISKDLFASRATAIIEGIRLKRLNKLLSSNADFAKAEDPVGQRAAQEKGLNVSTAPQVSNVFTAEGQS